MTPVTPSLQAVSFQSDSAGWPVRSKVHSSNPHAAVVSGCTIKLYHRLEFQRNKVFKINSVSIWWAL